MSDDRRLTPAHAVNDNDDDDDDEDVIIVMMFMLLMLYFYQEETNRQNGDDNEDEALAEQLATATLSRIRQDGEGDRHKTRSKKTKYDYKRASHCVTHDYWGPNPIFSDRQFERFFRVSRAHAEQILQVCARADPFFTQQEDACRTSGIDPKVKVLIALKCLAYGVSSSAFQDYFQMSESTGQKCIKRFTMAIAQDQDLKAHYLRPLNRVDARRVVQHHLDQHGVAGMIGSLDCMHLVWRTCPMAWHGQFKGKEKVATVVLEALADNTLWIWHANFGAPGTLNDINIWDRSPLYESFINGQFIEDVDFEFELGGERFSKLWALADGIYPELERLAKPFSEPVGEDNIRYSTWQEAARKDIERCFGVLQRKFAFLAKPVELWFIEEISNAVYSCIIMHNMMVEHRMQQGEAEDADHYALHYTEAPVVDTALETEERLDAEANLRAALLQANALHDASLVYQRNRLSSLRIRTVQRRWQDLHEADKHFRLQAAIRRQLAMNAAAIR